MARKIWWGIQFDFLHTNHQITILILQLPHMGWLQYLPHSAMLRKFLPTNDILYVNMVAAYSALCFKHKKHGMEITHLKYCQVLPFLSN